jgi:serine/threonine-protein kinase
VKVLAELRRRNVIRMAGLYMVGAWLATQVAGTLLPMFDAPAWIARAVVIALAIGFVPALVFAWVFELTPEGLKRDADVPVSDSTAPRTARRMEHAIVVLLALALGYFAFDKFMLAPRREAASNAAAVAVAARARAAKGPGKSIAVLPFVDMSQAKDQEYFSDGLSEELLDKLAELPQLKVIARTSSFSFKGTNAGIPEIARKLGVTTVLEGSVRKSGNTLRITAQLVRASDSANLWSDTYDRELTDVFKVQDEIAGAVVAALKLKLLSPATDSARQTDNMQAYEHYLLGNELMAVGSRQSYHRASEEYLRASDLDPSYVAAVVGRANAHGTIADLTGSAEAADLAMGLADRAIDMAPNDPDALSARAWMRAQFLWDWEGARSDYEAALKADPTAVDAMRRYAWLLAALGQMPEAIALARRVRERDPLGTDALWTLGLMLNGAGQAAEAARLMRESGKAETSEYVGLVLVESLVLGGDAAEVEAATRAAPGDVRLLGAALAGHALGDADASRRALDELEARYAEGMAYQIADVHAFRGEADAAFQWLDTACQQHDGGLAMIKYDPFLKPLRGDPRYAEMLRKLGLPTTTDARALP